MARFFSLTFLFFMLLYSPVRAENGDSQAADKTHRVLILISYHPCFEWSDDILTAIRTGLLDKQPGLEIHVEYMDTKLHPPQEMFNRLAPLYKEKYSSWPFNLIICVDNNALGFLLNHRRRLFPGVPVVFCGINSFQDSMLAGHTGYTGVTEDINVRGTLEMAMRLHPSARRLAVISGMTATSQLNLERVKKAAADMNLPLIPLSKLSRAELRERVLALPGDTIILFLDFYRTSAGERLSLEQALSLAMIRGDLPVYTLWEDKIKRGAMGGVIATARSQGLIASQMALQILSGIKPDTIPVIRESPSVPVFQYPVLKRFGIDRSRLPENSLILNPPLTFAEKYPHAIEYLEVAVVALIVLIIALLIHLRLRERYLKRLLEKDRREIQLRKKYDAILKTTSDAVIATDTDGNITLFNPGAEKLFHCSASEAMEQPLSRFFPGEHSEDLLVILAEVKQKGSIQGIETECLTAQGQRVPVEITFSTRIGEDENITGFSAILRNISERKSVEQALRETEERFRKSFDTDIVAMAISRAEDGTYLEANPGFLKLTGYYREEIIGHTSRELDFLTPAQRQNLVNNLKKHGRLHNQELTYPTKAGQLRTILFSICPISLKGEDCLLATMVDITERKEAEGALREALMRQKTAVKAGRVGLWDWDLITNKVSYSSEWKRQIGHEDHEIGDSLDEWESRVHSDDLQPVLNKINDLLSSSGDDVYQVEFRFRHKDGTYRWILAQASIIRDEHNKPIRTLGSHVDITERKEAEETASAMAEMLDIAPNTITLHDFNGRFLYANKKTFQLHGYSREEFMALNLRQVDVPESEALITERMELIKQKGEAGFEVEHYRKDGSTFPLEIFVKLAQWRGQPVILSIGTDITGRKQAEAALRTQRENLQSLFNAIHESVCLFSRDGTVLEVNQTFASRVGKTIDQCMGQCIYNLIPEDVAKHRKSIVGEILKSGEPVTFEDQRGEYWLRHSIYPVKNDKGEVDRLAVFAMDITSSQKAQAALAEQHDLMDFIIRHDPNAIAVFDTDLRYIFVSERYLRDYDIEDREVLGRHHYEVFPEMPQKWKAVHQRCLNGTIERNDDDCFERPDGSITYNRWICRPWYKADGSIGGIITYTEVTTERKLAEQEKARLEEQLRQSQKMEAIGQLTGGVAHDFNNLLQVINGSTFLAMEDTEAGHPARESILEIAEAGQRAARLVEQLLLFSRRQIMRPETINLNETIEGLLKMLRRVIGEHIQVDWKPAPQLGSLHADRNMIEQVLMNLCVNARDAMPEGGVLTIETQDTWLDEEYCEANTWASPGRYALLQVKDTGSGMDSETLERIFEPFFTTKEEGRGTGLGLATVYGIARQHDGMVSAESRPGKGSTFSILFPVCDSSSEKKSQDTTEASLGGTETLLLAEDDPSVRKLARRILERAGHTVLLAENGAEAVQLFQRHKERIAMVILDVVMPVMGGREAYEKMKQIQPDIKVLFASGYSEDAIHTNFVLNEGFDLLQKPYSSPELLKAVRQTLDSPAG